MSLKPEFVSLAKDFFAAQGTTQGLTGEQHTALVRNWICESIFTDYSTDALKEATEAAQAETDPKGPMHQALDTIKKTRAELYTTLYPLMNGSALRQRFEDAGVLKKTAGGRKSADAAELANKYV
jgi:hypothetical protein